jgi:hypothetical protein
MGSVIFPSDSELRTRERDLLPETNSHERLRRVGEDGRVELHIFLFFRIRRQGPSTFSLILLRENSEEWFLHTRGRAYREDIPCLRAHAPSLSSYSFLGKL